MRLLTEKSITFRPQKWLNDMINATMGVHRIKKKSEAIHYLLKELLTLREQQKQTVKPSISLDVETENIEVGCPALIKIPKRGYCCAINAPRIIRLESLLICKFCWERKQKLKMNSVPQKSTLYNGASRQKPTQILCKATGYWEKPLKILGRCERCKIANFSLWAECQKRYIDSP